MNDQMNFRTNCLSRTQIAFLTSENGINLMTMKLVGPKEQGDNAIITKNADGERKIL